MEPVVFGASVYIVVAERVLLGLHRKERKWLPIGGKRLGDETPLETARREAREEAGCAVDFLPNPTGVIGAPPGFFAYEEHLSEPGNVRCLCFAFVATVPNESAVTLCPREFSESAWYTHDALAAVPYTPRSLHVLQLARTALHLVAKDRRHALCHAAPLESPDVAPSRAARRRQHARRASALAG